jgi:hypothetical protein
MEPLLHLIIALSLFLAAWWLLGYLLKLHPWQQKKDLPEKLIIDSKVWTSADEREWEKEWTKK